LASLLEETPAGNERYYKGLLASMRRLLVFCEEGQDFHTNDHSSVKKTLQLLDGKSYIKFFQLLFFEMAGYSIIRYLLY
jgi:hypothetical protein